MNTLYWKNEVLSSVYLTGGRAFYIGLSCTEPQLDGSGVTEPTGGGYSRVLIDCFSDPADGVITNSETIAFPTSTADWFNGNKVLAYYVVFDGAGADASTLFYEALEPKRSLTANITVKIPENTLKIELADG